MGASEREENKDTCSETLNGGKYNMIFDSHAHYDDEAFDIDRDELLDSFPFNDIAYVVNVGADIKTSQNTVELTKRFPHVYGAVGIHPNEVGTITSADLMQLRQFAMEDKIVAIGEIGLDYYYREPDKEIQKVWFMKQMELARELKLPIIIHSRDAAKDTLDLMKNAYAEEIGGVVHCFSYSKEVAKEILDMNFYIGIGGVVTFQNAKKLKEAVKEIPLERIVLETDCPYLAPAPNRGKRNSSLNLPYVAKEIAKLKEISYEEVVETTYKNAKALYRMK